MLFRSVGLPVAVEFGKRRTTVGFDLASKKVQRLKQFNDATGEVSSDELQKAKMLIVTDDPAQIRQADYVIIAVPTPVNAARQPDISPLESASRLVGKNLKAGAIVIYAPGAVVCKQIDRFSSSVQSRLVRRAIKHLSVHYR